ncbi:MAG: hypothetical protein BRD55_05595 [Bacteroidetes bacterium SW_9_63_38]|nr:MAG: hypothetical protein BRD55_05595 [Bacteroidetes bacterium SW_9_63_38]
MKVFGIGLNKTGTTTLARCFRILGFCHTSCDLELTRAYQRGHLRPLFDHAGQFDSFEDWPWPLVYEEMDRRYENTKFILTQRSDAEAWYDSLKRHALRTGPTEYREIVYGHSMPFGKREEHLRMYHRHNEAVQNYFSDRPEDLLVACWEKDGWEKLCSFLSKDVPTKAFPHANKGRSRFLSALSYAKGYLQYQLLGERWPLG